MYNLIEVYTLKYYFESHLIYKWQYYIFIKLEIMVFNVDKISFCCSFAILWEIYVMWPKCHVRGLHFHFKRMLIRDLVNRLWRIPPTPHEAFALNTTLILENNYFYHFVWSRCLKVSFVSMVSYCSCFTRSCWLW